MATDEREIREVGLYFRSESKHMKLVREILREAFRMRGEFSKFTSIHEAHSVIEEEYTEFRTEVFASKRGFANRQAARKEAIQLAAVTILSVLEVIDNEAGAVCDNCGAKNPSVRPLCSVCAGGE